jgi:UDP-N-acetylglucosamine acyltransferase
LISHAVVDGRTYVGEGTRIFPFASIGLEPQDLKYRGEDSELVIGRNNTIREYVTMNPGTIGGGMVTRVGDNCLFMVGVHVAHDCQIGNGVVMANNATLAGHVVVEQYAVLGGLCAVHQYVRIGKHAMIGGMSGVERDVIPYGQVMGDRARLCGLNIVGMQRRGFSREHIQGLRNAYQFLFSSDGTLIERVNETAERFNGIGPVDDIIEFIRADSSRAICQPKGANGE